MTMQEAQKAAFLRLPVVLTIPGNKPTEYVRILQVGKMYADTGVSDFVQLLDKCGSSVVCVDPAYVEVNLQLDQNAVTGNKKG